MNIHLASALTACPYMMQEKDETMKGLLYDKQDFHGVNILESFFALRNQTAFTDIIAKEDSLLLDSGAFSFLSQRNVKVDFDKYLEEYAEFINKYDIKHFFELDIDSIVGLKETERLRAKLERLTNKQPILVWHKTRGKQYFIDMCKNYPYIAIGGIVHKEINKSEYEKAFPWFIDTAHENNAKIHGLGYTSVNLKRIAFDSVDSTAWIFGHKGGYLYYFDQKEGMMKKIKKPKEKKEQRLKTKESLLYNFNEWVKFSQYAKTHF